MTRKKGLVLLLLVALCLLVRIVSTNHVWVEQYYSNGLYPVISATLRYGSGWLPFSLGDIFYGILIIGLLYKIYRAIPKIFRRQYTLPALKQKLYAGTVLLLLIYILFNFLWGLNYNRKGIVYQLDLKKEKYTAADLVTIDSILVQKINACKTALVKQRKQYPSNKVLFEQVAQSYRNACKQYKWLNYRPVSLKSSLWGWAGNYIGFTGYYNPFTGEAQANTTAPKFTLPYTACHEVAHQLGYAKENEANFVGYLAATASTDTLFYYSAYLDLFIYTHRSLYILDSAKAKAFTAQLIPPIKADLTELYKLYESHPSPLRPLFKLVYGLYLRKNEQPSGMLTYDEVTALLIAYYKKTGSI